MQSIVYLGLMTGVLGFIIGIANNVVANYLVDRIVNDVAILNLDRASYLKNRKQKRYLVIELLSVALTMIVINKFGLTLESFYYLIFIHSLLILLVTDFEHQLLPDLLTAPLILIGLLYQIQFGDLENGVVGAVVGYLFLWSFYWLFKLIRKKEGMGYGDFKLLAALGAWLGWQVLPFVVLIGSVLAVALFIITGKAKDQVFAFGPFLIIAIPIASIWRVEIYV